MTNIELAKSKLKKYNQQQIIEAIDTFSMPGIIEINAVEYYANETEDDIKNGKVGSLIKKPIDPNIGTDSEFVIIGETFIKPKKEYIHRITNDMIKYFDAT